MKMNDRLNQILIILAVIAVVIVLTYIIDIEEFIAILRSTDKALLTLSTLAMGVGFVLATNVGALIGCARGRSTNRARNDWLLSGFARGDPGDLSSFGCQHKNQHTGFDP